MTNSLLVIVEKDEDGVYVAECPMLSGCYSQGKTVDEALSNIQEVIALVLEETEKCWKRVRGLLKGRLDIDPVVWQQHIREDR